MYAKLLVLCISVLIPAGLSARQPAGQLTVVAPPKGEVSYEKWSDRTTARLSRSVHRAALLYRDSNSTGYARVQFRLDERGRPQTIALAEPSSSPLVNRLSVRAVKAMGTLLPLPQQVQAGSKFEAWIVVANDVTERETLMDQLRAGHRARTLAQAEGDRPVLIAAR